MKRVLRVSVIVACLTVFGMSNGAFAQVVFDGMTVGDGAYRSTGSDGYGGFERIYVIQGNANPATGTILGAPSSCGTGWNNPATFPAQSLAAGSQAYTLLSTGGSYDPNFYPVLYFHVGTVGTFPELVIQAPPTPISTTAPSVTSSVGGYKITVSGFTWAASSPYLDRVGLCTASPDGAQDEVGHFTVTVAPLDLSQPNLLLYGSFEDGDYSQANYSWENVGTDTPIGANAIYGWTVNGIVNWHIGAEFAPIQDGLKVVDLENAGYCYGGGRGAISQAIPTVAGATYHLSFYAAGPQNGDPCSGPLIRYVNASIGGVPNLFTITASYQSGLLWELKEASFVATSS